MSRAFEHGFIPVCIVTNLANEIMFSHMICRDDKGTLINPWVVASMRSNETRFWNTSSAMIVLKCQVEGVEEGFGSLANVPPAGLYVSDEEYAQVVQGGKINKELYVFDEIRIWQGYLDNVGQQLDDLGDIFDPANPKGFDPVFLGYIETIKCVGTPKGLQIVLECYDRLKYLMNTQLITVPTIDEVVAKGSNSTGGALRTDVLLDFVNEGIGDIQGDVLKYKNDPKTKRDVLNYDPTVTDPEVIKKQIESDEDWTKDILTGTVEGKAQDWTIGDRLFYRLTTRDNIRGTDSESTPIVSLGDKPIEKIRILAMVESTATEFFQSQKNGNLFYIPRRTDETGFDDPRRAYRTYYYKTKPKDQVVCEAQQVLSMKSEVSGAGLKTDIWINSASSSEATKGTKESLNMHVRTIPNRLLGKAIPQSNQINFDQYSAKDQEAFITAISMASIWSREVQAAMMQIPGDASFVPGEAVRLYGFGILSTGASSPAQGQVQKLATDIEKAKIDGAVEAAALIEANKTNVNPDKIATGSPSKELNAITQKIAAIGTSYYTDETNPYCIMRVQAVIQDFASSGPQAGWKTEVALSSTF